MSSTSRGTSADPSLKEQASEKVQDVASAAQEKAGDLTAKGKGQLAQNLDRRTTDVGSQARSAAESLRQTTGSLREQGNTTAADMASRAADGIDRVGTYLEQKSGNDILRDVESFARRRPWAIAGLTMLGGIALARFLKASSETRYAGAYGYGGDARPYAGRYAAGGYVGTGYATPYPTPYDDVSAPLSRDPSVPEPVTGGSRGPER